METIYLFLLFTIGIIIAIGVGLEISKGIDEFIILVLFWFLYIITIITFINIILIINYYITMRNKQGPPGTPGIRGEQGDKGDTGKCDTNCRDNICIDTLTSIINDELKARNNGVRIEYNNIYLKSKIKQMCDSEEYKQLAPYNGPVNLNNYLKDIWRIWTGLLYDAGGSLYFETIGAEDQFDWMKDNPFDEIKKYDVFYWGMGKQYRPQIIDKCYPSLNGETPIPGTSGIILRIANTDLYDLITTTKGTQSFNNASFWRAKQFTYQSVVYYPVGDIITPITLNSSNTITTRKHIGGITLPYASEGAPRETILVSGDVKGPINYELLWTNSNTDLNPTAYFWVWRPIAPVQYIALGDIITTNADPPLTGDNAPIRCIPFDMVVNSPTNGNILWSSQGSPVDINLNILGFNASTDNSYISSSESNCYNLFRCVVGWGNSIPTSDINGNFYYIDNTKYDSTFQLGTDNGRPDTTNNANRVGKGIIPTPQRDSKYSVIAYLNLKNNPILTHKLSGYQLTGTLIPNAISNSYILKTPDNKCLDSSSNNNTITYKLCDELSESQYFSIIFTGNSKNECIIKHHSTNKILKYNNNLFTLTDTKSLDDTPHTLFIMS